MHAINPLADRYAARRFEQQIRAATAHHRWSTLEVETPGAGCVMALTPVDVEADQENLLAIERGDEPNPVNSEGYRRWFPSGAHEAPCLVPPPFVHFPWIQLAQTFPNLCH